MPFKKQRVVESKFRVSGSLDVDAQLVADHGYFNVDGDKIRLRVVFKGFDNEAKVYGIDLEDVHANSDNIVITKVQGVDSSEKNAQFSYLVEYVESFYEDV